MARGSSRSNILIIWGIVLSSFISIAADPYELPPQLVTAEASADLLAPAAGRSVLSGDTIAALGATTLAEALELTPALSVSPVGSSGALASVSLRGSTAKQVLVLVDGVRVSDPGTGQTDLSRLGISVEDIASIEVVRGGVAAQYGADAVGGVVLVTTKRGSFGCGFSLTASNLSYLPASFQAGSGASAVTLPASALSLVDGQNLSFRANLPGGFALSGSAERASNAYTYYDANYIRRARGNADLLGGKASLSWKGQAGHGELSAGADVSARSIGVPGSLSVPSPGARQRDFDARFSAAYSTDCFFSELVAFSATAYGSFSRLDYRQDEMAAPEDHDSLRAGTDARWSVLVGEASAVNAGVSCRYDSLESTVARLADGSDPERLSLGAYVEPSIAWKSWSFYPVLRWDWTNDFPSGLSFGLGASRVLTDYSSLIFSVSTAYRAPSFDDLYWPKASGAEGNPHLVPETAWCADIGLKWKKGNEAASLSAYARYAKDVILWQENDDGIWRPSNFGDAFYPGLEAEFLTVRAPWAFSVSYGFLYSYVLSGNLSFADDRRVPNVPIHSLNAAASWSSGPIEGSVRLSYKNLRYLTTANKAYLPALFLLGADLTWKVNKRFSVFAEGRNLLNERYESVEGYPMPGFSCTAGIRYRMDAKK